MSNCQHREVYRLGDNTSFGRVRLKCVKCYTVIRPSRVKDFAPTQALFMGKMVYRHINESRYTGFACQTCGHMTYLHKNKNGKCQVIMCSCPQYLRKVPIP